MIPRADDRRTHQVSVPASIPNKSRSKSQTMGTGNREPGIEAEHSSTQRGATLHVCMSTQAFYGEDCDWKE